MLAFQEEDDLLDDGVIGFSRGIGDAGGDAAMDVVLRAGPGQQFLFPPGGRLTVARGCPVRGIIAAGAKGKEFI